jgi:hypothetical protein
LGAPFFWLAPFFEEAFSGAACAPCSATAAFCVALLLSFVIVFVLSVSVLRFDPRMTIHHSAAPERQGKSDWLRHDQLKGEHTAILSQRAKPWSACPQFTETSSKLPGTGFRDREGNVKAVLRRLRRLEEEVGSAVGHVHIVSASGTKAAAGSRVHHPGFRAIIPSGGIE